MKLNFSLATMRILLPVLFLAVAGSALARSGADRNAVARSEPDLAGQLAADLAAQQARGDSAYARGDYVEALRVYRKIAVLGVAVVHYRLGLMYAQGLGTERNVRRAEYWLNLAVTENYPGAAAALAAIKGGDKKG